jgi:protein-ribulosamine 3-kinase
MNSAIKIKIEEAIGSRIKDAQSLSGGCINEAYKITSEKGDQFFLKVNNPGSMFFNEANGLNELRKAAAINVPEVYCTAEEYILTEFVEQGKYSKNFFETFGYQFATMHNYTSHEFGFYEDNFIGSTPQLNIPADEEKNNWVKFFFNKRLLYQFNLAEKNGYGTSSLRKAFQGIENKIEDILKGSENMASVLHGDLWGGNFICSTKGEVYLIDPAVYYGNREADLAMTKLFGRFNKEFYTYYEQTFPLPPGYDYRENIYKLYHVLNHLNLFGRAYYDQSLYLMNYYLR